MVNIFFWCLTYFFYCLYLVSYRGIFVISSEKLVVSPIWIYHFFLIFFLIPMPISVRLLRDIRLRRWFLCYAASFYKKPILYVCFKTEILIFCLLHSGDVAKVFFSGWNVMSALCGSKVPVVLIPINCALWKLIYDSY